MTCHPRGVKPPQSEKFYDLAFRQQVRHYIDTAWMAYLSPTECKLVNLLCARTIYWGKVWEVVTTKHMAEGCDGHFNGTGMTKKTVLECLKRLVAEGFVRRRKHGTTFAYSVNVLAMGTSEDPVTPRMRAHRVRLTEAQDFRVAKARAMRELTRKYEHTGDAEYLRMAVDLGAEKAPRTGVKFTPLRGDITPSPSATGTSFASLRSSARCAHAEAEAVAQEDDMVELPKKRASKAAPAAPAETDDTEAPRQPRARKRLTISTSNPATGRVVAAGRASISAAAPKPEPQRAAAPVPAQALTAAQIMADSPRNSRAKREADRRKGNVTAGKLITAWKEYTLELFDQQQRHRLPQGTHAKFKSLVTLHPRMPDPAMSWFDVLRWFLTDYGKALQLAVPFMLKTEEQRADLLAGLPKLSLFLHFGADLLDAYHRTHHGIGYTDGQYALADERQAEHERWLDRRNTAARVGEAELPAHMRTDAELAQRAREVASTNATAAQAVREFDAFAGLEEALRAEGATGREVQRELTRADRLVSREHNAEEHARNMQAVQDDQREAVRASYGQDLTDEECDELLRELYEDED